jgi:hypothetical protein
MLTISKVCLVLCAGVALSGCAALRLSGCVRIAKCGDLGAYSCEGDLVCADADGETIGAEPLTDSRAPCHICPARS